MIALALALVIGVQPWQNTPEPAASSITATLAPSAASSAEIIQSTACTMNYAGNYTLTGTGTPCTPPTPIPTASYAPIPPDVVRTHVGLAHTGVNLVEPLGFGVFLLVCGLFAIWGLPALRRRLR